ncbi:MAG: hypothetical protein KDD37_07280 [Bdellovibrionales bacterium]|nr:hypothetical protein [Bdellovibrionales bacterium]
MFRFTFLFYISIMLLGFGAHSKELPVCIGKGNPKNDFYIRDLEKKIARVQSIPKEIDDLKNKNADLDEELVKLQKELVEKEANDGRIKKFQESTLANLSARNTKKYQNWQDRIRRLEEEKTAAIEATRTASINALNEKIKSEILAENERHKNFIDTSIRESDEAHRKLNAEYKLRVAKIEKDYAQFVKVKTGSIDTALTERLSAQAKLIGTMTAEFNTWRAQQLEIIQTKRLDATSPDLMQELRDLEKTFAEEHAKQKAALDAELAKLPAMPKSIKDEQSAIVQAEIEKEYDKTQGLLKKAREEFDKSDLELSKSNNAKIEADKKKHGETLSAIDASKEKPLADIDDNASRLIRRNTELVALADKKARTQLSKDYSDLFLQFQDTNRQADATIKGMYDKINAIKNEQLANIKMISEDLPNELKKLDFIALWLKESPLFNTEAGVTCNGDCERAITKAPFQISSKNIDQACIEKAIAGKAANETQVLCSDAQSPRRETKDLCVDKKLADYIGWSLNKAIDCLSGPFNTIDTQLTFTKIANESTFRPFYSYGGGHGIGQTVEIAQNEMFGLNGNGSSRATGRKFLAQLMANSPNRQLCEKYKPIFDYEKEYELDITPKEKLKGKIASYPQYKQRLFEPGKNNVCQFISLEEGMHRSILNGLGLYLYYKDGFLDQNHDGINEPSADEALHKIGINKENKDYQSMKEYFTLAMYGPRGPGGAITHLVSQKNNILTITDSKGKKTRVPPNKLAFNDFKAAVQRLFPYMGAIGVTQQVLAKRTNDGELLQCATKYY